MKRSDTYQAVVFSDAHGSLFEMRDVMGMHRDADRFLFLGDGVSGFLTLQEDFPNVMFSAVRGNCDFGPGLPPVSDVVTLGSVRLYMTHGHLASSGEALILHAAEAGAKVALFGHTHRKYVGYDSESGVWLANPGSIHRPRDGDDPTFLVITVRGEDILIS